MKEGSILSRDELHAVTVYCRMPVEVTVALQKGSQYDPCTSYLDPQTGFAYLCTRDKCFVWSFASVSTHCLAQVVE
jgi:nuclear pore complex protein Nup133